MQSNCLIFWWLSIQRPVQTTLKTMLLLHCRTWIESWMENCCNYIINYIWHKTAVTLVLHLNLINEYQYQHTFYNSFCNDSYISRSVIQRLYTEVHNVIHIQTTEMFEILVRPYVHIIMILHYLFVYPPLLKSTKSCHCV